AAVWQRMRFSVGLLMIALAFVGACSSTSSAPAANLDDGLPASCSPLRTKGACMMPFPNAVWLDPDSSTKTGFRVALLGDALPASNVSHVPFDTTEYNRADGFSPGTPILAYFEEKIDVHSLVPPEDPSKSLDPSAATILVDMVDNK